MKTSRFTIVELMIVVAIVAVLAAIAIPQLVTMQLKAKIAELPTNADGIFHAELAYAHAYDSYPMDNAWRPAGTPGKSPQAWTTSTLFNTIGWRPDGAVRGQYRVADGTLSPTCGALGSSCGSVEGCFFAEARSDMDGNGQRACGFARHGFLSTEDTLRWVWQTPSGTEWF